MRQTLKFSITINASKEKVWNVLFTDENYPKWASVFCEGSNAKTDWKEGSEVQFTTPNGDGMFGIIEKKIPNKIMIFKHLGCLKKGEKIVPEKKSDDWKDAREIYELDEKNNKTELTVKMDSNPEYAEYFNETFPKALKRIKQLAE